MALHQQGWVFFSASLLACAADGGQTGDENSGPECVEVSSQTLNFDESSPAGFSAEDVAALVEGERVAPLNWVDEGGPSYGPEHGASNITIRVVVPSSASVRWIDLEATEGASNIAVTCHDRFEIEVETIVSTEGGALDETFNTTVIATQPEEAWVDATLPLADLVGSLTVDTLPESDTVLRVLAGFDASGSVGALRLLVEEQRQDGIAFQDVRIAAW